MKNKTILILLIGIILSFNQVNAQNLKGGIFIGQNQFFGELGVLKDGLYGKPAVSVFSKKTLRNHGKIISYIEMKTALSFTVLKGSDTRAKNDLWRLNRNLNFRSQILELSNTFQFSLPIGVSEKDGKKIFKFSPYLAAGLGVFYFNPQGQYVDGRWYVLQPLGTEGQNFIPTRIKYKRIQMNIPLGIGIKHTVNDKLEFEFEFLIRFTPCDYIDDVSNTYMDNDVIRNYSGEIAAYFADPSLGNYDTSAAHQRGDNTKKDNYAFCGISLIYNFGK